MPTRIKNYYHFPRAEWYKLKETHHPIVDVDKLQKLVSINDRLNEKDILEIYTPLLQYINIFISSKESFNQEKHRFLDQADLADSTPFIIGISGSVAVGKSTIARVLRQMLSTIFPDKVVELMTTDGFLYSNDELTHRGIYDRKGFPESYDMSALINFMNKVKTSKEPVQYPYYSHEIYDIVPDKSVTLHNPDILIVEGINTFQLPKNEQIYASDYFDFSIYVDADPIDIKQWYTDRYLVHIDLAKDNPDSFFYPMIEWSDEKVKEFGDNVWYTINLTNLVQNIEPTKERADVILHKVSDHSIDLVKVRKY